ncbi:MAG: hypothetical protein U5L96_08685 [Owenweeksia sp.]|nr:hypothetical protein [Owenweeksia sp.]
MWNYGGDIYQSYNDRAANNSNVVGQGVSGLFHYLYLRGAWLVNPASGLKVEAGLRWRQLGSGQAGTEPLPSGTSQYFFVGLRTELYNRYLDF